jgi:hypothetical protein
LGPKCKLTQVRHQWQPYTHVVSPQSRRPLPSTLGCTASDLARVAVHLLVSACCVWCMPRMLPRLMKGCTPLPVLPAIALAGQGSCCGQVPQGQAGKGASTQAAAAHTGGPNAVISLRST